MNPYKGLPSYEEDDIGIFRGREAEKDKLLRLVKFNRLTVIFGKSGIGKTSLLNAGLFPELKKNEFLPISLELKYNEPALLKQAKEIIVSAFHEKNVTRSDKDGNEIGFKEKETLWEFFRRTMHDTVDRDNIKKEKRVIPVLVLDQFEEIFTIGKNHSDMEAWVEELFYLIEDEIPDSLKHRILNDDEKNPDIENPINLRIIISLREDYLPHFTTLKSQIPSIDRAMFRIIGLNGTQAREVVGIGFQKEEVIDHIINSLSPTDTPQKECSKEEKLEHEKRLEIEPIFLSLLCQQIYEQLSKSPGEEPLTINDHNRILEVFYNSVKKDEKIEQFIENHLLTEGGFRTLRRLDSNPSLQEDIDKLVQSRILRKVYWEGKEYIEIFHDTLVPIIREKRNKRQIEEQKQKLREKYRLRKKRTIVMLLSFLLIIAIIAVVFSLIQKNKAEQRLESILKLNVASTAIQELPIDNTRAIRIAETAYMMRPQKTLSYPSQILAQIGYSSYKKPFCFSELPYHAVAYMATFSKDGSQILIGYEDGIARIWSPEKKIIELKGHQDRIVFAIFSPDESKYILTASWDKRAIMWDQHGKIIKVFSHSGPATYAVFSPTGDRVLTASRDGYAKLWGLDGKLLNEIKHSSAVVSAVFSRNGTRILTASWDRTAQLLNLKNNQTVTFTHQQGINSAVFSPDESRILTASADKAAKVWDLQGKEVLNLPHETVVSSAQFSPDGTLILTASDDGILRLWNLYGKPTAVLRKHNDKITSANFSNDGKRILTASRDGSVKMWNLEGELLLYLDNFLGIVYSAIFSKEDDRILTACEDGSVKVWNLRNDILVSLDDHTAEVNSAVFSKNGKLILTASQDRTAKLWDKQGNLIVTLDKHRAGVTSAIFSNNGKWIVTTSLGQGAKLWNSQGTFIDELTRNATVTHAAFSPDSQKVVTVSDDDYVEIYDINGVSRALFKPHFETISSAVFSPDSQTILTTSTDKSAKIFDLDGKLMVSLKGHEDVVISAMYSSDGNYILTASWDKTARLWSKDGKFLKTLPHKDKLSSATFSPDSTYILTSSWDKTAILWNMNGEVIATLVGHRRPILSAVFSEDSKYVVTASEDGTAKYWNLDGELLADLNLHQKKVNSAVFSPDGSRILTASSDGIAKIWMTPAAIQNWLKDARIPRLSGVGIK